VIKYNSKLIPPRKDIVLFKSIQSKKCVITIHTNGTINKKIYVLAILIISKKLPKNKTTPIKKLNIMMFI